MPKFARSPVRLFALFALSAASGCNAYYNAWSPDDLMRGIPWFDHMIKSRMVSPYSRADVPRYTVPGTVPLTGGEGDWGKEFLSANATAADRLVNPVRPDSLLARGDTLFHTFCSVCHGSAGAGDGPVGVRLGAPSLLTDKARAFSDGYLYSIIRYGRGLMPRYGDKIYGHSDRWAVVNYLRQLQGKTMPSVVDSTVRPTARPPVRQQ